jgi:hypothetical protein
MFNVSLPAVLGLLACAALPMAASADPADYVHTPRVEAGETEIGVKYGALRPSGRSRESGAAVGIGHGMTPWWSSEVYFLFQRDQPGGTALEALEWENTFSLADEDESALGMGTGFIIELQRSRDRSEGDELVFGPLLEKHLGRLRLNLNLLFSREYRSGSAGSMQLGYQFQARHAFLPAADIGMQAFGAMGKWNAWARRAEQSHKLGPAIFGTFMLGERYRIHYDAALLFEAANRQKGGTFRTALSYEF